MPEFGLQGMNEWQERLEKMRVLAQTGAEKFVREGGLIITSNAKRDFLGRPIGSEMKTKKGRVYYAGAPKYPAKPPQPTNRTGNLSASINLQMVRRTVGGAESLTGERLLRAKKYIKEEDFMVTYADGVSNIDINKLEIFNFLRNLHKKNRKEWRSRWTDLKNLQRLTLAILSPLIG